MPRPPLVHTEEILRVARAHFTSGGHTVSVHAIARELGVSHSALLQRFGSKRCLLIRAMQPPPDFPWPESFLSGPPEGFDVAMEQLRDSCEIIGAFFQEYSPCMSVLRAAGVEPHNIFPEGRPLPLRACEVIKSWVKRGQARGIFAQCDPAVFASAIVGAIHTRVFLRTLTIHNDEHIDLGSFDGFIDLFSQSINPTKFDRSVLTLHHHQGP